MADMVTHVCVAWLLRTGVARLRKTQDLHVATFVAGTVLPDVLTRVPFLALVWINRHVVSIPHHIIYGWEPMHLPVGMVLAALALSQLFHQPRPAFLNLLAGMALHLAVDLLQNHAGVGYLLGWPFALFGFELGWIGTEASVLIVPLLVPLTFWVWRSERRRRVSDLSIGG